MLRQVGRQLAKTVDLFTVCAMAVFWHAERSVLEADVVTARALETDRKLFQLAQQPIFIPGDATEDACGSGLNFGTTPCSAPIRPQRAFRRRSIMLASAMSDEQSSVASPAEMETGKHMQHSS